MANEQEREEIRNGFNAITEASVRPMRQYLIAKAQGWDDDAAEALARLIEIEERAVIFRQRNAVVNDAAVPVRPEWLDQKPNP